MMKVIRIYRLCLLPIVFAAIAILVSACSDTEYNISEDGETVDVIFRPELSGVSTRAINDASKIDELIVLAVADGDAAPIITSMSWAEAQNGVKVRLLQGRTYNLLFWAQHKDNGVYRIGRTIEADYSRAQSGFAGMENLDAFYAVRQDVAVGTTTVGGSITLQRPFAQLNLANETSPNVADKSYFATMTLTGLATVFDPFDGSVSGIGNDSYTFEYSDFPENDDPVKITVDGEAKDYYFIAMAYLLPVANGVKVEYTLKEGETIVSECTGEKAITVSCNTANTRYNLYGEMLVPEVMDDVYDGTVTMGTPLVDSYDVATGSYLVDECDDLIWMSDAANTTQLTQGNSFTLTKNLDFGADKGYTISPVILPDDAVINGNGKIIRNVTTTGGGLFGNAKGVTISDLTFEGVTASQSGTVTHVGTLFNIFTGGGIFNAITVNNSVVTTSNGAAGGIVGYIGAGSQVQFDDCHVAGTSVSGTAGEGHFVGLFRGYDNSETLTFADNCTCTPSADHRQAVTKYREGNEATWLAGNDYTRFNDYLGDEQYYRGVVVYGSLGRFIPAWDGKTAVKPLEEDGYQLIWSPFDLAYLQGKSGVKFRMMADVDMEHDPDGVMDGTRKNVFSSINTCSEADGNGHAIYNCSISGKNYYDSFINACEGVSVNIHDITFDGMSVYVDYDKGTGNAYAATVCSFIYGTLKATNVVCKNGYIKGVNKIGGLLGGCMAGSSVTLTNCKVDNYHIENYKSNIKQDGYYAHGEVGGLIGFIQGNVTSTACNVNNITISSFNENNVIAQYARHTAEIVGDIRAEGTTVNIGCSITGTNTYYDLDNGGSPAQFDKHTYKPLFGNRTYYDGLGSVYAVNFLKKGTVTLNNKKVSF